VTTRLYRCSTRSSWIQGAFLYAHAQLANDCDAEVLYKRALDAHAVQWPFQRARLNLAYGAWLRRRRRIGESRTALRAARDAFDDLDVASWAARARQELRAAGEASPKRSRCHGTSCRLRRCRSQQWRRKVCPIARSGSAYICRIARWARTCIERSRSSV
jgi:hypothetical protein